MRPPTQALIKAPRRSSLQVSNSGSSDLHMLVMFVLDATQPFSSPAELP